MISTHNTVSQPPRKYLGTSKDIYAAEKLTKTGAVTDMIPSCGPQTPEEIVKIPPSF
jgi:hypothetical protein